MMRMCDMGYLARTLTHPLLTMTQVPPEMTDL